MVRATIQTSAPSSRQFARRATPYRRATPEPASGSNQIEASINESYRQISRPGSDGFGGDRDEAAFGHKPMTGEMCRIRSARTVRRDDWLSTTEYLPGGSEVDEVMARAELSSK
jgi:hypothetical protein